MILADSSVWIDYFRGNESYPAAVLDRLIETEQILIGDLILAEVLQGFPLEQDFQTARRLMSLMPCVPIGGWEIAVRSAQNFRTLRSMGITVRKTMDCLIATCCIKEGYRLLHNDRDFDPFVKYLGLQVVV
ncbi:MAG: PIN domain nuclease [Bryobacterales bacterium]|nr:PIN domain nuclease [Bryobacterales bacterium]